MWLSNTGKGATMEVSTGDLMTEIYVLNAKFDVVAKGVGRLRAEFAPGIYIVRIRAGLDSQERQILLNAGDNPPVVFQQLNFPSPVPLLSTACSRDYHAKAAIEHSYQKNASLGQGSSVFVFSRDWSREGAPASSVHPLAGMTLCSQEGESIVALESQSVADLTRDPWAACNVEVNPGRYILRLALPSGQEISQTVVACPGWQTQIFLLLTEYGSDQRGADLGKASVMMSHQGVGFDANAEGARLVEIARLGLADHRKVLGSDIAAMLGEKFDNPMMGIYAGHLTVLAAKAERTKPGETLRGPALSDEDLRKLRILVSNVQSLIGPHPDCEALALCMGGSSIAGIFQDPPMLRSSWELIVNSTAENPDLIRRGSMSARLAPMLCGAGLWLQWRSDQEAKTESRKQLRFAVQSAINPVERPVPVGDSPFARVNELRRSTGKSASSDVSRERQLMPSLEQRIASEAAELSGGKPDVARLVKSFGIPQSVVDEILNEPPD